MRFPRWIPFIARRWFSKREKSIHSQSSFLAIIGIAAGTTALIVVMGIMNGLQGGYIDALLEVASFHIRISEQWSPTDKQVPDIAELGKSLEGMPGLRSILPFRESTVMVATSAGRVATLRLMVIPPDFDRRDPGFARELGIDGSAFAKKQGIVMGAEAAGSLGLRSGDHCTVLLPTAGLEEGLSIDQLPLKLESTFTSGFWQFDSGLALVSETDFPQTLGGQQSWQPNLGIKLVDRAADATYATEIGRRLHAAGFRGFTIESWRDYNRAFFGALGMEKGMMFLLLSLVFLVVAVNIHHVMRRIVAMRAEDIAILRSTGASENDMAAIFVWNDLATGIKGAFVGLLAGSFISVNINAIIAFGMQFIFAASSVLSSVLPGQPVPMSLGSVFYLQELPVQLRLPQVFFIALLAIASSLVASLSASRELSRLKPVEILRHE